MWCKRVEKRVVILMGLGLMVLTGLQAQRLYIGEHDRPPMGYYLSDIQTLVFSPGHISVHRQDGVLDTYVIMDLRNLNFRLIPTAILETTPPISLGKLHIFPNPVTDILNIQLPFLPESAVRIDIFSVEGKLVYSVGIESNDTNFQINLSGLAKGLYLCRINSGSALETARIIKQ